jgi:thiol-disulfide isomerase/thioredoxin
MRRLHASGLPRLATKAIAALAAITTAAIAAPVANGDPAPACAAPLLDGSRVVSVADFRGKVVYLDFWASWCGPCRQSFPFMNELQRELGDKGLSILAVSVDKVADDARRFLETFPARFTTVLDSAGSCPAAYRLQGMPSSYLIDRSGAVRAIHVGFREKDRAEIRRQVQDALEGRTP